MIRFTESFDKYGTDVSLLSQGVWTDEGPAGASLVPNGGICDTFCYRNTSVTGRGPFVGVPNLGDQFAWGQVAFRRDVAPLNSGDDDIAFRAFDGTNQCFFRFNADGSIGFYQGPNVTLGNLLVSSAAGVYFRAIYGVFEWEVTVDPTGGTVQAWLDGVEVIPLTTGLNTWAVPNITWTSGPYTGIIIQFNGDYRIDNVIFGDGVDSGKTGFPNNARIGPAFVSGLIAEADSVAGGGFYKQWTPLSGTDHGAMVNQNPPDDDTTYNSSPAPTLNDTYTFPNIKIGSGSVFAVNAYARVKKSDEMNTREIKMMLRSGGADLIGVAQAVPATTYGYRWEVFEGPDAGATAWSVALANAAEFGQQDFA